MEEEKNKIYKTMLIIISWLSFCLGFLIGMIVMINIWGI